MRVNGEVVTNASLRVDPERDAVLLDGAPLGAPDPLRYYALHKPDGVLSSVGDDRGRRTVVDLLPEGAGRCVPVGRLDYQSEGLLLLTNDGPLITALLHPSSQVPREYLVEVEGRVQDGALEAIFAGVTLPDGTTAAAKPKRSQRRGKGSTWLVLTLERGHKREVRQICAAVGHPVRRLIRVRFGPIRLRELAPGRSGRSRSKRSGCCGGNSRPRQASPPARRPPAGPNGPFNHRAARILGSDAANAAPECDRDRRAGGFGQDGPGPALGEAAGLARPRYRG